MPDISMCFGKNCYKKNDCYRFTAKPDRFQSYANFDYNLEKNCCDHFICNKDIWGK